MLISTADGISTKIIRCKSFNHGTSFQYVGSGANIVFEQPDEDFEPSAIDDYDGTWTPLLDLNGDAVEIGSAKNHVTIYGSLCLRVSKTAADGGGCQWSW